jgi:hypothetical protein
MVYALVNMAMSSWFLQMREFIDKLDKYKQFKKYPGPWNLLYKSFHQETSAYINMQRSN